MWVRFTATAFAVASVATVVSSSDLDCVPYTNMPGGDLANMPVATDNSSTCYSLCEHTPECMLYSFIGPESPHSDRCDRARNSSSEGCCWLKSEQVGGRAPVIWDEFACSGFVRVAPNQTASERISGSVAESAVELGDAPRNVLYIVVDDLRNDLEIYGQNQTHNPNIFKLGQSRGATVFDNAYCQISVCSPSR